MKKLFATGLVAVMALGLSTAAFAAADDTYSDVESISIAKYYVVDGEGSSPAETFSLVVSEPTVVTGEGQALALTVSDVTVEAGAANNGATSVGAFEITLPDYDAPGIYEYTLTEDDDNNTLGVTYSDEVLTLRVTVLQVGDDLVRVPIIKYANDDEDKLDDGDGITNTYTANQLSVTKDVTGNMGDRSKAFEFTVTFGGAAYVIDVADGFVEGEDYTINGNTVTFNLIDDATFTFENIPAGVTYTVEEADYSDDGYTTTYAVNGDEVDEVSGTMDASAVAVTVNNHKDGEVDTGINLDNLPYVMVLAVVLVAGGMLLISRRRRFE